ncbi:MAG: phosphoribosylamine--glycine ligase [Candidatus Gastranaerophilales bacterium]|nr:phosphoribosylamine--glycine ligase [Candidatus Gastranaerophilales bacterium]
MRILVVGSSAKEHAIIWKLFQGESVEEVFCAPGNIGTEELATNIDIRPYEIQKLLSFAKENQITLTIASSKVALDAGIVDAFQKEGLVIFGPTKNAMRPIMNRSFSKKFFHKYKIPTPKFGVFEKESQAVDYARSAKYPLLLKLDTSTPDINTFKAETFTQAKSYIERIFANLNKKVIIEEFKDGKEITLPVLTDGYNAVPLPSCVLYKKMLEGNGGTYTNGIGAYAMAPVDSEMESIIANTIVFPTIDGLSTDKMPYVGVLTFRMNLLKNGEILVTELDSEIGNIETQTVMPLIKEDLARVYYSCAIGALGDDYQHIEFEEAACASVMIMQAPYPAEFEKGNVIEIDEELDENLLIFYNKVKKNKYFEKIVDGGQVLSLSATGLTLSLAVQKLYSACDCIQFEGKKYRKDIGETNLIGLMR